MAKPSSRAVGESPPPNGGRKCVWPPSTLVPTACGNRHNGFPWSVMGMAWFGWALASMVLMGLGNLGMKAAGQRGLSPAAVLLWVVIGEVPLAVAYWLWRGRPGGSSG